MNIELSVVIPAHNEAARLGLTLGTVLRYLKSEWAGRAELIVVDDGSTDATAEVAEHCFMRAVDVRTRVLRVELNKGKGHAVKVGLLAARGQVSLFSDADLSTPISETPKLVGPIIKGEHDVVFGSRALDRSLIEAHQPWRREQGGRVFNRLVRLLTGMKFHDTQCGFKTFRSDVCRPVFEAAKINRFGFDVELLYIAQLAGLRLLETPVRWMHREGSKVDFKSDSVRMLNEVRAIRRHAKRGTYDDAVKSVMSIRGAHHQLLQRLADTGHLIAEETTPELITNASRAQTRKRASIIFSDGIIKHGCRID